MVDNMEKPITAILIGAGSRGMYVYGNYALKNPEKLKFVAVAESKKSRREEFAKLHHLSSEYCFETWEDLFKEGKLARVAFICTPDQLHVEPTLKALDTGYDILLEKPMAHTLMGCIQVVKKAEERDKILGVGHVLRYTSFFSTIHETIQNGLLGEIINITHRENVTWYHMAHSFVRGNWRNAQSSSPMILQKCCHDLDLLFWMVNSIAKKVSSFGSLSHFRSENAPKGAPNYCMEGCPIQDTCLYFAPRIYVNLAPIIQLLEKSEKKFYKFIANLRKNYFTLYKGLSIIIPSLKYLIHYRDWPVEPLYSGLPEEMTKDYSDQAKLGILKTSPYGRCVYKCDNNVVDHQIVNIEFENGVTANLTMHGFSEREGRSLRIDGTKATLIGDFCESGEKIILFDHLSGGKKLIFAQKFSPETVVHGGGDSLLINAFLKTLQDKENPLPLTNARESLESHLIAFAAEESRLKEIVVDMNKYRKESEKYSFSKF